MPSEVAGAISSRIFEIRKQALEQFEKDLKEKIAKALGDNEMFAEAARDGYRGVVYTPALSTSPEGIELAEQAEALARREKIPYGEALKVIKTDQAIRARGANQPKAVKFGETVVVEDPNTPLGNVEMAQRADAVQRKRNISYRDALEVVRQAEWLAEKRNLSFAEAESMISNP